MDAGLILKKQAQNEFYSLDYYEEVANFVLRSVNSGRKRIYINKTTFFRQLSSIISGKIEMQAPHEEFLKRNRNLYYTGIVLHLTGHTTLSQEYLNQHEPLPKQYSGEEAAEYLSIGKMLHYSNTVIIQSLRALNKVLLWERISLKDISIDKIIAIPDFNKCILNILTGMGIIQRIPANTSVIDFSSILICSPELEELYLEYLGKISGDIEGTKRKKEKGARFLLDFLALQNVTNIKQIDVSHIINFINWLKDKAPAKFGSSRSSETIITDISRLKSFLTFMDEKQLLSESLREFILDPNEGLDSFRQKKIDKRHKPIPKSEIERIERMLYEMDETGENWLVKRALILAYLSAGRPSEILSLWLDCIRGTPEVPLLYFHRGKHFTERYVPMTEEMSRIVQEVLNNGLLRLPIEIEYDNYSVKRLFGYRGNIPTNAHLNRVFNRLQLSASPPLVSSRGQGKYSIYVLRRIRITKWLEAGIPETEVAQMAGHFSGVDNHNAYLVGAETRKINCMRAYNKFYKEQLNPSEENSYGDKPLETVFSAENFIAELAAVAERIENTGLRNVLMEEVMLRQPEVLLPVPCGFCMYGSESPSCNLIDKCLSCKKILIDLEQVRQWAERLYKIRKRQEKKGMAVFLSKTDVILSRLKALCITKLSMTLKEISEQFKEIKVKCEN